MTKEEKNLLLKDLCARLPYGVFVEDGRNKLDDGPVIYTANYHPYINDCKPYLRPMSSMTEEEKWDFGRIFNSFSYLKLELLENGLSFHEIYDITGRCDITWNELNTAIDWLNAHHFDYHGLIQIGLALPAPEGMYNTKTE